MAAAITALAASCNPGTWTKSDSAEENLRSFDRYAVMFERWLDICEMEGVADKRKWSIFMSTGGIDLEDLVLHQAKVEVRAVPEVAAVQAAQGPPPVVAVAGVPAVVPTPWHDGIARIRLSISRYTNQIMARNTLMWKMPASDYSDWRKWGQELLEQAKRCLWEEYTYEDAALDALLYQCPDANWKTKILQVEDAWWHLWHRQVFDSLLPYKKWKTTERNLRIGDICTIKYEDKIKPGKGEFRLCRIHRVEEDEKGVVRTVWVNMRKRDSRQKGLLYKIDPKKDLLDVKTGVQRLVAICPAEEVPVPEEKV